MLGNARLSYGCLTLGGLFLMICTGFRRGRLWFGLNQSLWVISDYRLQGRSITHHEAGRLVRRWWMALAYSSIYWSGRSLISVKTLWIAKKMSWKASNGRSLVSEAWQGEGRRTRFKREEIRTLIDFDYCPNIMTCWQVACMAQKTETNEMQVLEQREDTVMAFKSKQSCRRFSGH